LFSKLLALGTLSCFAEAASVRSKLRHISESKLIFLCSNNWCPLRSDEKERGWHRQF